MRIVQHHGHFIFRAARGQSSKPLRRQFNLLFAIVAGLNTVQSRRLWHDNGKWLRSLSIDLDRAKQHYVRKKEKLINFGNPEMGIWVMLRLTNSMQENAWAPMTLPS